MLRAGDDIRTGRYSVSGTLDAERGEADIMCGIIGILSKLEVAPLLFDGLKRLE
jgi:hypothetical protein